LVEAGQQLTSAFLQSGLVDRIYWFRAPQVIGEAGMDALKDGATLDACWKIIDSISLSPDRLDVYECSPA
jgi:riboflavin biosynthesis pyrimidine reductase